MSIAGGPDMIQDGLVLSLDAADRNSYAGSGTAWLDLSGNGNNGTLTNGPTFSSANQGSIVFDGVDDYASLPSLNLDYPFNISFFGKEPSGASVGPLISFSDPSVDNKLIALQFSVNLAGAIRAIYYDTVFNAVTFNVSVDRVYQVSTNFTSTGFDLYVNGVYTGTLSGAKTKVWTDTASSYNIGYVNRTNSFYAAGNIYNAQIYNRALSASEVLQNYNSTKTRFGL